MSEEEKPALTTAPEWYCEHERRQQILKAKHDVYLRTDRRLVSRQEHGEPQGGSLGQ